MKKKTRELDFSKLKFSEKESSMEEALKDVISFPVSDKVLSGKAKLSVYLKDKEKDYV